MHSANYLDGVWGQCGVHRDFDKGPHAPIPETSTASTFAEKLQVDLLFPGDFIANFTKYAHFPSTPILTPGRWKNPQEVRDAFCYALIGVFGRPKSVQNVEGGQWENEVWADECSARRIKLRRHGVGAYARILGSRGELARGIRNRAVAAGRLFGVADFGGNSGAP